MGASASQLEQLRGRIDEAEGLDDSQPVPVWAEHWHAFQVFRGMATQWRVTRAERRDWWEGLDYAGLPVVLDEHRRLPRRWRQPLSQLMRQLRVLERSARDELNKDD
jgi:hypothetical protein